jgi:hypothetical protein
MPVAALHLLDQFVGPARRKMTGRIGDLENCGTRGECAEWSTNRWIPVVRPRTIPGVLLQALGLAAAAAARPPTSSHSWPVRRSSPRIPALAGDLANTA